MASIYAEIKHTLWLSLPLMISAFAQIGMETVDSLMMGWLGPEALAAGGLGIILFYATTMVAVGIVTVSGSLIARAHGADKSAEIRSYLQQALWLGLLLSVPLLVVLWFIPDFLVAIGEPLLVVQETRVYLHKSIWGIPAALLFVVVREFVSALECSRGIVFIALSVIPLDAVFNYLFMYGKLGLPAMGFSGIGLGTALAQWFSCLVIILYALKHKKSRAYIISWPTKWQPQGCVIKEILRMGWPVGMLFGFEAGLFTVCSILMGYFGEFALAAHQIALQSASTLFVIPVGIAQAAAVRVGYEWGAGRLQAAVLAGYVAIGLGLLAALLTAGFFWVYADFVVALFIADSQQVRSLAVQFLRIAAVFLVLDSLSAVSNGVLRGFRDTLVPMWLGLVSFWVLGIGSGGWFAFYLDWQGQGIWWGLAVGFAASGLCLFMRYEFVVARHNRISQ